MLLQKTVVQQGSPLCARYCRMTEGNRQNTGGDDREMSRIPGECSEAMDRSEASGQRAEHRPRGRTTSKPPGERADNEQTAGRSALQHLVLYFPEVSLRCVL